MADVMAAAKELCQEDSKTEQRHYGQLLPCRKISPLEPFIKLDEYFMLERDSGKYLLYMAALDRAAADIVKSRPTIVALKCLVLGPGLGRLVRFCIDCAHHCEVDVTVHVLEANPVAVQFIQKSFEQEIEDEIVHLYEPIIFHSKMTIEDLPTKLKQHSGTFDITVSELLGCFGDDEFLPEITSTLFQHFVEPEVGIMIPDTWTNYLVPVSCPSTFEYLTTNHKCLNSGYTMGLPNDCIFLSDTKAAWTGDCRKAEVEYGSELDFDLHSDNWIVASSLEDESRTCNLSDELCPKIDKGKSGVIRCESCTLNSAHSCCHGNGNRKDHRHKNSSRTLDNGQKHSCATTIVFPRQMDSQETDTYLHGFIGYFTSILYKDIVIDTRHTLQSRNSFHWECYFLPLTRPVLITEINYKIQISIRRKCDQDYLNGGLCIGLRLWYEWQVKLETGSKLHYLHHPHGEQDSNQQLLESRDSEGKYSTNLLHCTKSTGFPTGSSNFSEDNSDAKTSNSYETDRSTNYRHTFPLQNRDGEYDAVYLCWPTHSNRLSPSSCVETGDEEHESEAR